MKKKVGYSTHHRRPVVLGGTNESRNLSLLPKDKHRAWHILFSTSPPAHIVALINRLYLDPDYELVLKRRGE